MPGLPEFDTDTPVVYSFQSELSARSSSPHCAPTPEFVSQLIAARDRLPPQRHRRTNTAEGAVGAYGRGMSMADRRMPLGYRKTVVA
ncbi:MULTISPECIES: hypothetical protein [unclassified Devosia]|uniref:hypothetical protein n=1 Tax=unclassified Devosia TaxID=196773 RepID=UPI00145D701C|nr:MULTISPECIES: hypothetical protein [unclassified Devosia]MBJ6987681.1 hypothetical protein [Devosia sp. MC521]MBJ7578658.1 hypothetical protein [Devosia sp. MC532]MBK1795379.1 hypothetical protein [Devosia sp. WQ 349K1]QMW62361.1 hypothetical protein H4N61_15775 [Devosia sp. MC521]